MGLCGCSEDPLPYLDPHLMTAFPSPILRTSVLTFLWEGERPGHLVTSADAWVVGISSWWCSVSCTLYVAQWPWSPATNACSTPSQCGPGAEVPQTFPRAPRGLSPREQMGPGRLVLHKDLGRGV